jgi:hypothetical protein
MTPLRFVLPVIAAVVAGGAVGQEAATPAKPASEDVSIPFARLGGIDDWRADGNEALYIKGRGKRWYHAKLMSPCIGLNFAEKIGFVVEPSGSFDKFSAIVVEGRVCNVVSLVRSAKPEPKTK